MLLPLQVTVLIKCVVFVKIVKFPCDQNVLGVGLAIWRVRVQSSRDLFFYNFLNFIIVIIVIYHFNDLYIFKLAMILALIQNMPCTCSIKSKGLSFGIHQGKLDSWRQIILIRFCCNKDVSGRKWRQLVEPYKHLLFETIYVTERYKTKISIYYLYTSTYIYWLKKEMIHTFYLIFGGQNG